MSEKDTKTIIEIWKTFEFYLANLKDIVVNHDKPSKETLKILNDMEEKIDEKLPTSLFYKAVGGSISLAIIVGLAMIGGNYKVMTKYLDLYQQNFVTKSEYLDGMTAVQDEIANLRADFEFAAYPLK